MISTTFKCTELNDYHQNATFTDLNQYNAVVYH